MSTIFPLSASVGQEFDGYMFDGTRWNIIGNEFNPTSFSSTPPSNPQPGDLWVDADSEVEVFNDQTLIQESDLAPYLTIASASTTYATKTELENIDALPSQDGNSGKFLTTDGTSASWATVDISSASAAAVAAIVDSAPETLNTLNELAAALNDDANYASTVAGQISNLNSGLSQVITNKLDSQEAYSTFLTSASMETVPVYLMNSGGSAQRPVSASVGMFRYNTDSGEPEWYSSQTGQWVSFSESPAYTIEFLLVAGGGGGGGAEGTNGFGGGGAGGGAGGVIQGVTEVVPGTSYSFIIGGGGAGGVNGYPSGATSGANGENTSGFGFIAIGGGGGAGDESTPGNGGSGGGVGGDSGLSPGSGTSGQGFAGGSKSGRSGGGGGGAAEAGSTDAARYGGDGILWSNGSYYGGGGGGGAGGAVTSTAPGGDGGGGTGASTDGTANGSQGSGGQTPGTANTGGGGGAAAAGRSSNGQNGGSGVVIVRYFGMQRASGGVITSSGGYTYHTFNSSGSFVA